MNPWNREEGKYRWYKMSDCKTNQTMHSVDAVIDGKLKREFIISDDMELLEPMKRHLEQKLMEQS
jgi:hypothetical protein